MAHIGPGDNTVRIAGFHRGRNGIYDTFQFNFINLDGHVHGINYAVPAGTIPGRLVRDLLELRRLKFWFTIYLKELKRELFIVTIKEPKEPQAYYWNQAKKLA